MNKKAITHKRPAWIKAEQMDEEELCSVCFRAVGVESRYKIICALGKMPNGAGVTELTKLVKLKQPTVTYHLNVLKSVDAVHMLEKGRERIYSLNRKAHCFEECKIPY